MRDRKEGIKEGKECQDFTNMGLTALDPKVLSSKGKSGSGEDRDDDDEDKGERNRDAEAARVDADPSMGTEAHAVLCPPTDT